MLATARPEKWSPKRAGPIEPPSKDRSETDLWTQLGLPAASSRIAPPRETVGVRPFLGTLPKHDQHPPPNRQHNPHPAADLPTQCVAPRHRRKLPTPDITARNHPENDGQKTKHERRKTKHDARRNRHDPTHHRCNRQPRSRPRQQIRLPDRLPALRAFPPNIHPRQLVPTETTQRRVRKRRRRRLLHRPHRRRMLPAVRRVPPMRSTPTRQRIPPDLIVKR